MGEQLKKKGRWKKALKITGLILLILVLLFVGTIGRVLFYGAHRTGDANGTQIGDTLQTPEDAEKSEIEDSLPMDPEDDEDLPNTDDLQNPPDNPPPVEENDDVVNILIVGQDSKNTNIRTRSDTMILISVHTEAKQVTLTSFMRDAYVKIPGYANNKLNSAYEKGGLKLLNETLKVNFGVEVDGNVIIDFNSFKDIIDMLGGVDIELTAKEAEYLVNGGKHDVKVGMNRLNGKQALDYARLREIDSDYQRTNRQRKVIMSIIQRYKQLPITEMLSMVDQVLPMIVTDMDEVTIVGMVLECGPVAATAAYGTQQIPANGTFDQGYVKVREGLKNWFQYNIDFEENRRIIEQIMNGKR